ncbi:MAG: hypothetical protein QXM31_00880 [Candidatus Woesearchaeota archaeon]
MANALECITECFKALDKLCSHENINDYFFTTEQGDAFQPDAYKNAFREYMNSVFCLMEAERSAMRAVEKGMQHFGGKMAETFENLQKCPVIAEKYSIMEDHLKKHQNAFRTDREKMKEYLKTLSGNQEMAMKEQIQDIGKELDLMDRDLSSIRQKKEQVVQIQEKLVQRLAEICEEEEARPLMAKYLERTVMLGYIQTFLLCGKMLKDEGTIRTRMDLAMLGVSAREHIRSYQRSIDEKIKAIKPEPDMEYLGRLVRPNE